MSQNFMDLNDIVFLPETAEENTIPIFLGEGDEQIQIGKATLEAWRDPKAGYKKIVASIDVFPGERLTFSRIAKWDEVVEYSRARYHKE